jgi:Ribbon-helix-helix protein, copG family
MKRRLTVQLPEQLVERLEAAAAEQPGQSKSGIVEAALDQFLSADADDDTALPRRLNWMSRQLEQLDRDLRIVNETVALHARYNLTVTPPLPNSHHRAACVLGLERFEAFVAQVGRRVHLGTPLMRETLDRLSATNPDLFARDIADGVPLGTPSPDLVPDSAPSAIADEPSERPAAAQEGGSSPCFPKEGDHWSG